MTLRSWRDSFFKISAAAVLMAMLIVPGLIADVAAQGSDVILACVNRVGDVRIVIAPTACRPNETLVRWNVRGEKGETGVKGDKGDPGTASLPAPPCFSNGQRYADCGNGTVTDTVTGLLWLKSADCLGSLNWADANAAAATLKHGVCALTDGSAPGQWRLPAVEEWAAAIARAVALGCKSDGAGGPPSLINNGGTACYNAASDGPGRAERAFPAVAAGFYWSGSTFENNPGMAWVVSLNGGWVDGVGEDHVVRVWPVRRY